MLFSCAGMGYAPLEAGIQTLNAITLSAGIGTVGRDALAAAALLTDVRDTNKNHLAVGHAGAKARCVLFCLRGSLAFSGWAAKSASCCFAFGNGRLN